MQTDRGARQRKGRADCNGEFTRKADDDGAVASGGATSALNKRPEAVANLRWKVTFPFVFRV
jgi:hypothetical protein